MVGLLFDLIDGKDLPIDDAKGIDQDDHEHYADLPDVLPFLGLGTDDIAIATTFTTRDPLADMKDIAWFVRERLELPDLCRAHLDAVERAVSASCATPPRELAAEVAAWDILSALFGDEPGGAPRGSAADRHRRRAKTRAWLRDQAGRVGIPEETLRGRRAAATLARNRGDDASKTAGTNGKGITGGGIDASPPSAAV